MEQRADTPVDSEQIPSFKMESAESEINKKDEDADEEGGVDQESMDFVTEEDCNLQIAELPDEGTVHEEENVVQSKPGEEKGEAPDRSDTIVGSGSADIGDHDYTSTKGRDLDSQNDVAKKQLDEGGENDADVQQENVDTKSSDQSSVNKSAEGQNVKLKSEVPVGSASLKTTSVSQTVVIKSFSCVICGVKFSHRSDRDEHSFLLHNMIRRNVQEGDSGSIQGETESAKHTAEKPSQCVEKKLYQCYECNKLFPTQQACVTHFIEIHETAVTAKPVHLTTDVYTKCSQTDLPPARKKPYRLHPEQGQSTCLICGKEFNDFTSCSLHLKGAHNFKQAPYDLPASERMSANNTDQTNEPDQTMSVSNAEMKRTQDGDLGYICSICSTSFPSALKCNEHMKTEHKIIVSVKSKAGEASSMDGNSKQTKQLSEGAVTVPDVNKNDGKPSQKDKVSAKTILLNVRSTCSICKRKFPSYSLCMSHMRIAHPSVKTLHRASGAQTVTVESTAVASKVDGVKSPSLTPNFMCGEKFVRSICKAVFLSQEALQSHQWVVHGKGDPPKSQTVKPAENTEPNTPEEDETSDTTTSDVPEHEAEQAHTKNIGPTTKPRENVKTEVPKEHKTITFGIAPAHKAGKAPLENTGPKFVCSICGAQFLAVNNCYAHMKTVHLTTPIMPRVAPPVMKRNNSTASSKEPSHLQSNIQTFCCSLCGAGFPSLSKCNQHIVSVHLPEEKPMTASRPSPVGIISTSKVQDRERSSRRSFRGPGFDDLLTLLKEISSLQEDKTVKYRRDGIDQQMLLHSTTDDDESNSLIKDVGVDSTPASSAVEPSHKEGSIMEQSGDGGRAKQIEVVKKYQCSVCSEKFPELKSCVSHMKETHGQKKDGSEEQNARESVVTMSVLPNFPVEDDGHDDGDDNYRDDGHLDDDDDDDDTYHDDGRDDDDDDGDREEEHRPRKRKRKRKRQKEKHPRKRRTVDDKGWAMNRATVFPCEMCDEIYTTPMGLNKHISSKHCGTTKLKCRDCKVYESAPTEEQLKEIAHGVIKLRDKILEVGTGQMGKKRFKFYAECMACGDRFGLRRHYHKHTATHSQPLCRFCDVRFLSYDGLAKHINAHNCGPLKCETCGQTYFGTFKLLKHALGHGKLYTCKRCGVSFQSAPNLRRHMANLHPDGEDHKVITCPHCPTTFTKRRTLLRHVKETHPEEYCKQASEDGQHICHICGARFKHHYNLSSHLPLHNDTKFVCDACGCWFTRESMLALHKKRVHENSSITHRRRMPLPKDTSKLKVSRVGGKPLQCKYCGKKYYSKRYLRDHERRHTGESPYKCSVCELVFRTSLEHLSHVRTVHKVEKTFKCEECGKEFPLPQALARHRRTHTLSLSTCDVCGKQFGNADRLSRHKKVRHTPHIAACTVCSKTFPTQRGLTAHLRKVHNLAWYGSSSVVDSKRKVIIVDAVRGTTTIGDFSSDLITENTRVIGAF